MNDLRIIQGRTLFDSLHNRKIGICHIQEKILNLSKIDGNPGKNM